MRWFLGFLMVATGLVSPGLADGEIDRLITASDKEKLAEFNSTRLTALREADAGAAEDMAVLKAALAGAPMSFESFDATGAWSCRVIKLGGILPLTVYPQFRCIIKDDGKGWRLTKISGSQQTTGTFHQDSGTRLIYLGSGYVAGDTPKPYGTGPESDQVAYAERLGAQKIVLMFPKPYYESHFDLLVLERK